VNIEIHDAALEARIQKTASGDRLLPGVEESLAPLARDPGRTGSLAFGEPGNNQRKDQPRHRATRPRRRNPGRSIGCSPGESEKPNLNERALCSLRRRLRSISSRSGVTSKNRPASQLRTALNPPIREKNSFSCWNPLVPATVGRTLTDEDVRFFPVYSYLIVYRPRTEPLQSPLPFFTDAVMWNGSSKAAI